MTNRVGGLAAALTAAMLVLATGLAAAGQAAGAAQPPAPAEPFTPRIGQAGKDVVWVPTPPGLLDLMLDMAGVTKDDFVMDLGSGDGRNIIAAARRGARGVGVEYNPEMVALSRRLAAEAGVADLATFVQGDMYEADISKATVMPIFLLPSNMDRLLPRFQTLAPGSRIVSNTFGFTDWDADERRRVSDDCSDWCEALLWIVPASAAGTWQLDDGTLTLTQLHQVLYGKHVGDNGETAVTQARMRGTTIAFALDGDTYTGELRGDRVEGTVKGPGGTRPFRMTRQR